MPQEIRAVRARCRRSRAAALLAFAAATALSLGCGAAAPSTRVRGEGGTAVVALPNDLRELNPLIVDEAYSAEIVRYALFLPLVEYGPKLEYLPRLAERWEMLGDTGVVFHLRRGVTWSDGVPVTAEDALFTYERAKEPKTAFPNSDYFSAWNGGEVVDSYTVRFHFAPHAEPLAGLPFLPIVPKHALDSIAPERLRQAAFNHQPITDGPFRVTDYRANDRWTLEANPDFPQALGGRPHLDRLVLRIIPENAAQVTELLSGGADLILSPRADDLKKLASHADVRPIVRPSRRYAFIGWNGKRRPFGDARVRRALAMALDRKTMLDVLRGGHGEIATGPIGSYHWAFDRTLAPLPYAPDSAKALLAAAGYTDRDGDDTLEDAGGRPLRFELTVAARNDFNRDVAELVRAQLARVGVQVVPRFLDFSALIDVISSPERRFDAVFMMFESDFRLGLYDQFHSAAIDGPFQLASYRNAEVDRILDEAPGMPDRARALPLWHRLQRILRDEQPWTVLWYAPDLSAARTALRTPPMDIRGTFADVAAWRIEPPGALAVAR